MKTKQGRTFQLAVFAVFALLVPPSTSHGAEIEGPRVLGMGGAYSAIATGPDTIRINPAGIGMNKVYLIKAAHRQSNEDIKTYNLSILDFKTSSSPLGISFTREEIGEEERDYGILSFSNSGSSTLIGLSIKYFKDTLIDETDYSYDIGLLMRPTDDLNIGLVGKNIESTDLDFVHETYTAGVAYKITSELTVAADYSRDSSLDDDNTVSAIGIQYALNTTVSIRGGYNRDEISDADYYSAGLSIFDRTGYLEYGYRWNKDDRDDDIHSVSLSLSR
ncbi:MAG: conjugal transfer protein TraF [bacterium]|nr:conjugal transfer protein TraF [bacterium]